MRTVSGGLSAKLSQEIQTKANKSAPSSSIWINRPTTPLTNDKFLEKQNVFSSTPSDIAIAVCHPNFGGGNTKINIAYVLNGVAKVIYATPKVKMRDHIWLDTGFEMAAEYVAIAYDGTMPHDARSNYEFITEDQPWIFLVHN